MFLFDAFMTIYCVKNVDLLLQGKVYNMGAAHTKLMMVYQWKGIAKTDVLKKTRAEF